MASRLASWTASLAELNPAEPSPDQLRAACGQCHGLFRTLPAGSGGLGADGPVLAWRPGRCPPAGPDSTATAKTSRGLAPGAVLSVGRAKSCKRNSGLRSPADIAALLVRGKEAFVLVVSIAAAAGCHAASARITVGDWEPRGDAYEDVRMVRVERTHVAHCLLLLALAHTAAPATACAADCLILRVHFE